MLLRVVAFVITLCAMGPRVLAYSLTGPRWSGSSTTMQLQLGANPTALADGFASWGASAEDALARWNANMSTLRFAVVRDATATRAEGNRVNNVFFSDDIYGDAWGANVLAVTLIYSAGSATTETDVLFNNRLSWNSYRGSLRYSTTGLPLYDFHRVALHEFGHALGLDHPDENGQNVSAVMNSHITSLDTLTSDDIAGAQALYGAPAVIGIAPLIITPPVSRSVVAGANVTFSVAAGGTEPLSYQWRKNGIAIPGATAATLSLLNVQPADAASYAVLVGNSAGTTLSPSAILTVSVLPVITAQPANQTVAAGGRVSLSVTATGTGVLSYRWRKDGADVPNATSATLTFDPVQPAHAGSYVAVVSNAAGSTTSAAARITIASAPVISAPPIAQTVTSGERAVFTVSATSPGTVSYQWFRDGVAIPGATAASFTLETVRPADGADYSVRITNATGSVMSAPTPLTVKFSRLTNLSTRGFVPAGGALTPGFYVRGSNAKSLLIRAVGPTLSLFGVGAALGEAKLDVIAQDSSTVIASNNDWGGTAALSTVFASVGAFPLAADSKDAALQTSLLPRSYTVRVTPGDAGMSGITLAEIYDAEALTGSASQLVNVSTLGFVGSGDNVLTAGFAISGNAPKRLLIRAVGPGLAAFGVGNPLTDPQLGLVPLGRSEPIATNDDWPDADALRAAFIAAGAFALPPGSKDAALVITLEPGAYTVIVSGVNGTASGNALVEIYDLDP
jgi:hypothetical protein